MPRPNHTIEEPNPSGLCQCGCGGRTSLSQSNNAVRGNVYGKPVRFIAGHQRRKSPVEFVVDPETGCWRWQRDRAKAGYGLAWTTVGGVRRRIYAHRLFYERLKGPIPEGMTLDHVKAKGCRYRDCVNPDHLEPVTRGENTRRGSLAKLTHATVAEIRALRSEMTAAQLSDRYGVHANTIRNVLADRVWVDQPNSEN